MGDFLPNVLLYDFMSISEKDAEKIVKRLEKNVPEQGSWGSCHPSGEETWANTVGIQTLY
jgi:hypothetical protein